MEELNSQGNKRGMNPSSRKNLDNRVSGNPNGNKKTRAIFKHVFDQVAAFEVETDSALYKRMCHLYPETFKTFQRVGRETNRVSLMTLVTMRLFHEAMVKENPTSSIKEIYDRAYGKAPQTIHNELTINVYSDKTIDELEEMLDYAKAATTPIIEIEGRTDRGIGDTSGTTTQTGTN